MSFAALAAPLAIGGGIMQAVGSIQAGNAKKAEALAREEELKREAELGKIAGDEQQASRLRELHGTLGAVRALTAQRGLSLASPSAAAIQQSIDKDATRDARRLSFNTQQQGSNLRLAGRAARASGNAAQTAGYVGAASSLFKAAADARSQY